MWAIRGEFETYAYRRVGAAGTKESSSIIKVRRLMREHDKEPGGVGVLGAALRMRCRVDNASRRADVCQRLRSRGSSGDNTA